LLFSLVVGGLLVVPSTQAQDRDGIDLDWGVSAGGVSSTFQGNPQAFAGEAFCGLIANCVSPSPVVGDRRVGAQFGAGLQAPVTDWAVVRAEVRYRQVGGTIRHQTIRFRERHVVRETADYSFHELQMPVLAEARLPEASAALTPSVFAGPALGVNLGWTGDSRVEVVERRPEALPSDRERDPVGIEGKVRSTTLSAVAGAALAYALPSGREVALEVRYQRGLTGAVVSNGISAQTGSISVGLRYLFSD
jgi:opacity protein-like surface antigen